jgi:hypothetical protein
MPPVVPLQASHDIKNAETTGTGVNTSDTFGQTLGLKTYRLSAAFDPDLLIDSDDSSSFSFSTSHEILCNDNDDKNILSIQPKGENINSNDTKPSRHSSTASRQHQHIRGFSVGDIIPVLPMAKTVPLSGLQGTEYVSRNSSDLTSFSKPPGRSRSVRSLEKPSGVTIVDATRTLPLQRKPSRPEMIDVRGTRSGRPSSEIPAKRVKVRESGVITATAKTQDESSTVPPIPKFTFETSQTPLPPSPIKRVHTPNFSRPSHPSRPTVSVAEVVKKELKRSSEFEKEFQLKEDFFQRPISRSCCSNWVIVWTIMMAFPILFIGRSTLATT